MNKVSFIALMFVVCCLSLLSCGNRNPNLSKKQLLALENDTTQTTPETPAYVFPDTSYVPPAGAKYTEIRSVDPVSPPVTLKVGVPQGEKETLKLSRFGSSVEYVVLRLPDENDFFLSDTHTSLYFDGGGVSGSRLSTKVSMMGDHFITSDVIGVRLFDASGSFVQNLILSDFAGQERNTQEIKMDFNGYKSAILSDFSDTRCFITMIDYESDAMAYWHFNTGMPYRNSNEERQGKVWTGEFVLANRPIYTPQSEIAPLTPGVELVPARGVPSGKYMNDNTRFDFHRVASNTVAVSYDNMGDTLCKFTNHVIGNGGAYASDRSFFYRADDELFFRQEFCDTIFRVQSANRIVPAFCFDFGTQRLTPSEGAANKTQGKLIPWKWFDFKNFIILIFTEGRDCPNCRTRNEVTFHCLRFDKQTGRSTAIDMQSRYPENFLIENDIDGEIPIPLNSLHREGNGLIITYTKNEIEEILRNNIPPEMASKLKSLTDMLKQNEMLVMIIK